MHLWALKVSNNNSQANFYYRSDRWCINKRTFSVTQEPVITNLLGHLRFIHPSIVLVLKKRLAGWQPPVSKYHSIYLSAVSIRSLHYSLSPKTSPFPMAQFSSQTYTVKFHSSSFILPKWVARVDITPSLLMPFSNYQMKSRNFPGGHSAKGLLYFKKWSAKVIHQF